MTVGQLIAELRKFPEDMPVAVLSEISWKTKDEPNWVDVSQHTCIHNNYPYDEPDFEYVNLE